VDGRFALIVANGTYADPKLNRLRSPSSDAAALARVLRDPDIGGFQVDLAEDEPEHLLRRRIARFFADRGRDDLLLLHLACHGLKDESGQLYFATSDTEVAELDATAVSAEFLARQMNRSRSRKVVALLDCCYSGAIARGLTFRAGGAIDVEDHLGGHGRVIITASSAMEYAFEGDQVSGEGDASVFTTAVVRALETGEADRDQDHLISVDELYDYVCERLREVTSSQRPNMLSHLEGELYVARSSYVIPVAPAELPAELRDAMHSPLAGVRGGAVAELAELLERGDPASAVAARAALEELSHDDSRRVAAAAAESLGEAPAPEPAPAPRRPRPPAPMREPTRTVERRWLTALVVLGGALVVWGSLKDTSPSWLGLARPLLVIAGLAGAALAFRLTRTAAWLGLLATGGFAAGAGKAASTFQGTEGHAIFALPVLLGAAVLIVAGLLGARAAPDPGPRRLVNRVLLGTSVAFMIGLLLHWTPDEAPGQLLGISLEATLWGGAILVGACAVVALVPAARAAVPVPPDAVAMASSVALIGVLVVAFAVGRDHDTSAGPGYWVCWIAATAAAVAATAGASPAARAGSG
jgi:hypothetical protein